MLLTRCTLNVRRAGRGAGTAAWISSSYGCSAAGSAGRARLEARSRCWGGLVSQGDGTKRPGQQDTKRLRRGSGSERRWFPWHGGYCWDSRALRLAFIFSSRFTRCPLLTSSSSVLSSAERSWRKHRNMKLSLSCYPLPKQCKVCSYQH